jgi:hypothetical protein
MSPVPVQQTMLEFMFQSLGWVYGPLLLASGAAGFLTALLLVLRGRGPLVSAAVILAVNVPVLIGLFGFLQGTVDSFSVIATSTVAPKPNDLATGISTALVTPLVGILVAAPGYVVAIAGSIVRSLWTREPVGTAD